MNRNAISHVEIWPANPEEQIRRECETFGLARPVDFRAAKRANFDNLALLAILADGSLFLLEHAPISGGAGVILNRKRTPEELAFMDRYGIHDSAASAFGRIGGHSRSDAKRAASARNGEKGGRPTTEFHFGKVFRSEGGFRVCGGVHAGGPILSSSPWFATREEAERVAAEMIARRAENERLDRLAGLRP